MMACIPFLGGFVCGFHPIYDYAGWLFEMHSYCGPWPLRRKDCEPRKRAGRRFYDMIERWQAEPEKERFRVS